MGSLSRSLLDPDPYEVFVARFPNMCLIFIACTKKAGHPTNVDALLQNEFAAVSRATGYLAINILRVVLKSPAVRV